MLIYTFLRMFRYGFLIYEAYTSQDPLSVSVAVLQQFNIPPEMYQVGFTKLYLRTGQVCQSNFVLTVYNAMKHEHLQE